MAAMSAPVSFLLRLRVERGRLCVELVELRSGRVHALDGPAALWRFLRARRPGLH